MSHGLHCVSPPHWSVSFPYHFNQSEIDFLFFLILNRMMYARRACLSGFGIEIRWVVLTSYAVVFTGKLMNAGCFRVVRLQVNNDCHRNIQVCIERCPVCGPHI